MRLLDTCVWIEAIIGSATGERMQAMLLDRQNLLVPTLVQFELRRWALRELDEERADDIVLATREGRVVTMDEGIALLAADLAASHQLDALDALIYATALVNDAELVTCDPHFKGLPQVGYFAQLN